MELPTAAGPGHLLMASSELIVNPDTKPKHTFWSVPPFRQRLQTIARTVKLRDVRFFIAQVYGGLYLLYGLKIPLILFVIAPSIFGTGPSANDLIMAAVPYLLPTAIVCGLVCAFACGGIAWYIMGRAMRTRDPGRLRCAVWGAIGAGSPMLLLIAIAPVQRLPLVGAILILVLLFGAGLGVAFHWVIQRDQAHQELVA